MNKLENFGKNVVSKISGGLDAGMQLIADNKKKVRSLLGIGAVSLVLGCSPQKADKNVNMDSESVVPVKNLSAPLDSLMTSKEAAMVTYYGDTSYLKGESFNDGSGRVVYVSPDGDVGIDSGADGTLDTVVQNTSDPSDLKITTDGDILKNLTYNYSDALTRHAGNLEEEAAAKQKKKENKLGASIIEHGEDIKSAFH
jgi:hypothetical protein